MTQVLLFWTFVRGARGLAEENVPGMNCEGLFWFMDLTSRDDTMILPLTALGLTYYNLDRRGRERGEEGWAPLEWLRASLQSLVVLAFPLTMHWPSLVFMYWIPSSLTWTLVSKGLSTKWAKRFYEA